MRKEKKKKREKKKSEVTRLSRIGDTTRHGFSESTVETILSLKSSE